MWIPVFLSLVAGDAPAADAVAADPPPAAAPRGGTRFELGLDAGLDVATQGRLPMAGARVDAGARVPLGDLFFASVGVRSGYSYAAGQGAVADPVLGVDNNAFLMAHRVPIRARGALGVHGPADAGVVASGGADLVLLQGQSFGRTTSGNTIVPGFSVGGFVDVPLSDSVALGVLGEWDAATTNLAAVAPGLSGDLSALRVALHFTVAL